ncbi:Glycosyl transferase [Caenorhabditis elegans]|uniref:Glycosyl transferase n=1 Tax=Caenorhabditis elegans TaxID=6239 RepID=B6VQ80_CAEEL|nr:Glycosyl transferase [Caenorhabditis elegans]CAR97847.1 Glycosyl transferase [Caenorhabditis elegans]|eukprot:NP_001257119.1 Uncharacterized protein CELE_T21E8.6 [Caenorhabditis elegans]
MWVSTLLRRFFYRRQRNSRFIEKQMRNMTVKFQDTWKVCDMAQNYYLDEALLDIQEFASLRNYHFQLVDGLDVLLHDPNVRGHTEFPLQIESLKRSGAFIVMHASENYDVGFGFMRSGQWNPSDSRKSFPFYDYEICAFPEIWASA